MNLVKSFARSPSAGGVLLLITAALGVWMANSSGSHQYFEFLEMPIGPLSVELWINDALMAIFFLGVGMEVKHEMIDGELNTGAKRFLPSIGAFFGVCGPAIIYTLFNYHSAEFIRGWAIPTATDIAFAIGIISIIGPRVPVALKVFLTTLAVVDDLIAVIIIAAFYTDHLQFAYMGVAVLLIIALVILNKKDVIHPLPYIVLGLGLWYCVFQSGLHATLSGVILAMTIPYKTIRDGVVKYPLNAWNKALANWITFVVIPLFGFANAGVSFGDFQASDLFHPVVLGVALGLFLGKQIGVFGTMYVLVKTKIVPMPNHATWAHVYGIALCCGIGFTMSLFVNLLALPPGHEQEMAKVGIFIGSILSGVCGFIVLRYFTEDVSAIDHRAPIDAVEGTVVK